MLPEWIHHLSLASLPLAQGVAGFGWAYISSGLIWSVVLGFAAGNCATSLVYRLPRGRLLLDKTPYCGSCGTLLKTVDLFPVFSALILRHKCRYCGAPIPKSHFWTEILTGLLFCACFLQFNFSQEYLLVACIGIFLIVMVFIEVNDNMVMPSVLVTLAILGALLRTLHDHELYNFFFGGFMAMMLGALAWRKEIVPVNHVFSLGKYHRMTIAAAVPVGAHDLPLAAALWAVFFVVVRLGALVTRKRFIFSVPLSLAVITLLFIPR